MIVRSWIWWFNWNQPASINLLSTFEFYNVIESQLSMIDPKDKKKNEIKDTTEQTKN